MPLSTALFDRAAVVSATYWEARGLIAGLGLRRAPGETNEYRDGRGGRRVRISGIGADNARKAAEGLLEESPTLIISAGFAGALQPDLRAGDLAVDAALSHPDATEAVVEAGRRTGLPVRPGSFYCSPSPLMTAGEKRQISARTGALAVEMESQAVFELCRSRNIPFCSLRAISDGYDQDLPRLIQALDSSGRIGTRFWAAFLTHPGQWPGFFRLAASSRRADSSLTKLLLGLLGGPRP